MYEDSCMLDIHDIEFPVSKHKGIFIDIFVLDDVPDSEEEGRMCLIISAYAIIICDIGLN